MKFGIPKTINIVINLEKLEDWILNKVVTT